MLRLCGISEELPETLELDDYVAVQITWGAVNYPAFEVIWQLVTDQSIFQIGLYPRTRLIRSLTLVLAQNKECDSKVRLSSNLPQKSGTPMFEQERWPEANLFPENGNWPDDRVRDEAGTFDVHLGNDHLFINLFHNKQPHRIVVSGRVLFGLDAEDTLCSIEVENLTSEETSRIRKALQC